MWADGAHICDCPGIDNLVVQNTCLGDPGLRHLARRPALTHLRLEDNFQLTDACRARRAALVELVNLQILATSIGRAGLELLVGLGRLADLLVDLDDGHLTEAERLAVSARMPTCTILVKGHGVFEAGELRV